MKVVSGSLKGRQILIPAKSPIRPTTDKVRAALFSTIGSFVQDARVLDAFAGTGSFGIEAISRGARHVTYTDKNTKVLKSNMGLLAADQYTVLTGEFQKHAKNLEAPFDILFFDPPYGIYDSMEIFRHVIENTLCAEDGLIIYEESIRTPFSYPQESFDLLQEKKYGDTAVYYLEPVKQAKGE